MSFKCTPFCTRDLIKPTLWQKQLTTVIAILLLMQIPATQAQDLQNMRTQVLAPSLEVTPARCVALHQGQICYQSANLVWQAVHAARYCLFISNDTKALKCWPQQNAGSMIFDFQSPNTQIFRLRNMDIGQDLVQTQLSVAWVYGNEKRRRTSWRLF